MRGTLAGDDTRFERLEACSAYLNRRRRSPDEVLRAREQSQRRRRAMAAEEHVPAA